MDKDKGSVLRPEIAVTVQREPWLTKVGERPQNILILQRAEKTAFLNC